MTGIGNLAAFGTGLRCREPIGARHSFASSGSWSGSSFSRCPGHSRSRGSGDPRARPSPKRCRAGSERCTDGPVPRSPSPSVLRYGSRTASRAERRPCGMVDRDLPRLGGLNTLPGLALRRALGGDLPNHMRGARGTRPSQGRRPPALRAKGVPLGRHERDGLPRVRGVVLIASAVFVSPSVLLPVLFVGPFALVISAVVGAWVGAMSARSISRSSLSPARSPRSRVRRAPACALRRRSSRW